MTNYEIVDSFLNHKQESGVLSTDGKEIKSYETVVARWKSDGSIVMPDASENSDKRITRCRNLVRRMALSRGINVTQVN